MESEGENRVSGDEIGETTEKVMQLPQVTELQRLHTLQRERLALTRQPIETTRLAVLAVLHQCKLLWVHSLGRHHRGEVVTVAVPVMTLVALASAVVGPLARAAVACAKFVLWWVGLGVASSIGVGSGLHTFVLYLGPHIATFAVQAAQCGRVDFKASVFDTPQWGSPASWQGKNCTEIGEAIFPRLSTDAAMGGSFVLSFVHVLHRVHLEVVLWGIGTAIGELPPYFVSRAARLSGEKVQELESLVAMIPEREVDEGRWYCRMKVWALRRFSQLGFFSILAFASVPNPLFDLAGVICGHSLVPFWKFFLATVIGKAIIKTHVQTVVVIVACNPHVVEAVERALMWVMVRVPILGEISPRVVLDALGSAREAMSGAGGVTVPSVQMKGGVSIGFVWNTAVQLIMAGFVASIVTATAQGYLMEQQRHEIAAFVDKLDSSAKRRRQEDDS